MLGLLRAGTVATRVCRTSASRTFCSAAGVSIDTSPVKSTSISFDPNSFDGRTFGQTADGEANYETFKSDFAQLKGDAAVALPRPGDKDGTFNVELVDEEDAPKAVARYQAEMFMRQDELGDPETDKTFLEAIGFDGWNRYKVGALAGLVMMSKELYVINDETLVMAGLLGGFLTIFTLVQPEYMAMYNTAKKEFFKTQRGAEEKQIQACETFISLSKSGDGIAVDVASAIADQKALVDVEAKAKAVKERQQVVSDFDRRLQSMVNKKNEEVAQEFQNLLNEAEAFTKKEVATAAHKKAFMKHAITAITTPAKAGGSPVAKIYQDFFNKRFKA